MSDHQFKDGDLVIIDPKLSDGFCQPLRGIVAAERVFIAHRLGHNSSEFSVSLIPLRRAKYPTYFFMSPHELRPATQEQIDKVLSKPTAVRWLAARRASKAA